MVTKNRTRTSLKEAELAKVRQRYAKYAPNLSSANDALGKSESRKKILIVCEGEKTEPNYFNWLKDMWRVNAEVEIIGACGDPLNVVKMAAQEKAKRRKDGKLDFVFAVFDKDDFSLERINQAYQFAERDGIRIVFSNEAFELWYLLHFDYIEAALDRDGLCSKLGKRIGKPYLKNDASIFGMLSNNVLYAIKNAMKLEAINGSARENPYTSAHWLIMEFARAAAEAPDTKSTTEAILKLLAAQA